MPQRRRLWSRFRWKALLAKAMPDALTLPRRPRRPRLTLPGPEAALVSEAYGAAGVVLEYGSGGSTVLAAELPGKRVFSVESDPVWAGNLQAYLDAAGLAAGVSLHVADIGPTGDWGAPVGDEGWRRYHRYPLSVWDRADFRHPDVVLVDGRFRAACFVAVMVRITRPVTLLFDDYVGRKPYHRVETWAAPVSQVGRMARFQLEPRVFPSADITRIFELFTRPQ